MLPWPNAEFWRLWGVALALSAIAGAFFLSPPAHALTVRASFYDQGRVTASGAPFRPMGFTAASLKLPFGTRFIACFRNCHDGVVNDHGPYVAGRGMDVSRGLARAIGLEAAGVANITVRVVGRARTRERHGRHRAHPRGAARHRFKA